MTGKNYIYSTLSTDQIYAQYAKSDNNDLPIVEKKVHIHGGANVVDKKQLVTPRGVVTHVSDEDLALLESNQQFQRHKKNGFIVVDSRKVDPEVRAADMVSRDDSAPMTPEDYDEDEDGKSKAEAKIGDRASLSKRVKKALAVQE